MAKQKKNSNYVTDKTIAAKAQKEEQKQKEKKTKNIKIIAISVGAFVAFVALVFGILAACGAFKYDPKPTYHARIQLEDYGTLHVELYGEDAPKTVAHFVELSKGGYFKGMRLHTLEDGLFYGGALSNSDTSRGIKGEFSANGYENNIIMEKGVIVMSRGDNPDSAYGQFFIVTEDNIENLQGNYAAFGKITDLEVLDEIIEKFKDVDGRINETDAPKIVSIDLHESH